MGGGACPGRHGEPHGSSDIHLEHMPWLKGMGTRPITLLASYPTGWGPPTTRTHALNPVLHAPFPPRPHHPVPRAALSWSRRVPRPGAGAPCRSLRSTRTGRGAHRGSKPPTPRPTPGVQTAPVPGAPAAAQPACVALGAGCRCEGGMGERGLRAESAQQCRPGARQRPTAHSTAQL